MQLKTAPAPFFRRGDTDGSLALSRIIAFCLILIGAIATYGFRSLIMAAFGVLGSLGAQALWNRLAKLPGAGFELYAVELGLCCALLLPGAAPVWLPLCSAAFAMCVTRLVFGARGRNPLNPAAISFCFAALCCADLKSLYNSAMLSEEQRDVFSRGFERCFATAGGRLPLFANIVPDALEYSSMLSPSALLRAGVDPRLDASQLLLFGKNAAMGAAGTVLILVCIPWLVARGAMAWRSGAAFLASAALLALLFPYQSVSSPLSAAYELFTGSVLFAAVFLCSDISCSPHSGAAQLIFGCGCGALSVLLRRVGAIEGGEIFAVLLMSAISSPLDELMWRLRKSSASLSKRKAELVRGLRIRLRMKNALGESYAELEELERESARKGDGHEQ